MNNIPSPSMPVAIMTTRRDHGDSPRRYPSLSPEQSERLEGDFAATEAHIRKAARRCARWSAAEIDDLVRDARTKLVDSLTHPVNPVAYPPTIDEFRSLFLRMLGRSEVDLLRRKGLAGDARIVAYNQPELRDDKEEFSGAVDNLVFGFAETLPPKQKDLYRDWLVGRTRQESADRNGISIKTVDNQMEAILRKLRAFLVFAAEHKWQVPEPTPRPGQPAVLGRTPGQQRTRTLVRGDSDATERLQAMIRGLASRHAKRTAAKRAPPT